MKTILKKIQVFLGIKPKTVKNIIFGFRRSYDENDMVIDFLLHYQSITSGVTIDVGLCWGDVSLPFLKAGWTVYGFEPDNSAEKVKKIRSLSRFDNFVFDNRLVSDKSNMEYKFFVSDESPGISSIYSFSSHKNPTILTSVNLTDFIHEKNIAKIDFLKIDTEGHDLFVLKGFPFDEIRPKIIIAEFDNKKTEKVGYTYREIGDLILAQKYTVYLSEWYPIKKYGGLHKFKRLTVYPAPLSDDLAWGNFIAVDKDSTADFEKYISSHQIKNYLV